MRTIDNFDRRLLHELDQNARASVSILARALRAGRDKVAYRISSLKQEGVLRSTTVLVNPYRLGLAIYKTYLKVENVPVRVANFLEHLRRHPQVYWVAECDGSWDIMFSTFSRGPKEFHDIQREVLGLFGDVVLEFDVFVLVDVHAYPRNYLRGEGEGRFAFGGSLTEERIDDIDYRILGELAADARTSLVEIGRRLDVGALLVKYRIRKMEDMGIIVGYRANLDLRRMGMTFFKAQLLLRSHDPVLETELQEHCLLHPNITYFIRQIGSCRVEIEMEVEGHPQFIEIISEIKVRFPRLIRGVESTLVRKEWFQWVPGAVSLDIREPGQNLQENK